MRYQIYTFNWCLREEQLCSVCNFNKIGDIYVNTKIADTIIFNCKPNVSTFNILICILITLAEDVIRCYATCLKPNNLDTILVQVLYHKSR